MIETENDIKPSGHGALRLCLSSYRETSRQQHGACALLLIRLFKSVGTPGTSYTSFIHSYPTPGGFLGVGYSGPAVFGSVLCKRQEIDCFFPAVAVSVVWWKEKVQTLFRIVTGQQQKGSCKISKYLSETVAKQ